MSAAHNAQVLADAKTASVTVDMKNPFVPSDDFHKDDQSDCGVPRRVGSARILLSSSSGEKYSRHSLESSKDEGCITSLPKSVQPRTRSYSQPRISRTKNQQRKRAVVIYPPNPLSFLPVR